MRILVYFEMNKISSYRNWILSALVFLHISPPLSWAVIIYQSMFFDIMTLLFILQQYYLPSNPLPLLFYFYSIRHLSSYL